MFHVGSLPLVVCRCESNRKQQIRLDGIEVLTWSSPSKVVCAVAAKCHIEKDARIQFQCVVETETPGRRYGTKLGGAVGACLQKKHGAIQAAENSPNVRAATERRGCSRRVHKRARAHTHTHTRTHVRVERGNREIERGRD